MHLALIFSIGIWRIRRDDEQIVAQNKVHIQRAQISMWFNRIYAITGNSEQQNGNTVIFFRNAEFLAEITKFNI